MRFRMVRSGGLIGPAVSAAAAIGHGRRGRRRNANKPRRRHRKAKRIISIAFPPFKRRQKGRKRFYS